MIATFIMLFSVILVGCGTKIGNCRAELILTIEKSVDDTLIIKLLDDHYDADDEIIVPDSVIILKDNDTTISLYYSWKAADECFFSDLYYNRTYKVVMEVYSAQNKYLFSQNLYPWDIKEEMVYICDDCTNEYRDTILLDSLLPLETVEE